MDGGSAGDPWLSAGPGVSDAGGPAASQPADRAPREYVNHSELCVSLSV